jgi:hypothetical protein
MRPRLPSGRVLTDRVPTHGVRIDRVRLDRVTRVVAVAALLAVTAACASDSSSTAAAPRRTEHRTHALGPGCRYIIASTGRRVRQPTKNLIYLTDAVAEPTVCYDKITFSFDKADGPDMPPGYIVEYRKPPFVEGIHTTTEGFKDAKAYLYIEMQPTSTVDLRFAGSGRLTYRGNQRLALEGMQHAVIVEWLKDYQDTTPDNPLDDKIIWVIGLDKKVPFTVDSANQPPRISVLIMHPASRGSTAAPPETAATTTTTVRPTATNAP